jgi:radical SAM superfamily enzyme YgiQ (UPF0313 family)
MEKHPFIDIIARGEYEFTVLETAKALKDGKGFEGISGITYRKNNAVIVNATRPHIENLDSLPFPARDQYRWQKYHEPIYEKLPWITMISSRGCPFNCIFCSWPQVMYGHKFRARSVGNVLGEIEHCLDRYKPGEIFFDDDTFTIDQKRVRRICEGILDRKLDFTWSCMGRIDTVDTETMSLMRRAGCRKIKFGVETGDTEIMKTIKKRIDLNKLKSSFLAAGDAGLKVHGTFMIGLPGETRESVYKTIRLVKELPMDTFQLSVATPFPGTEFYDMCAKNNWLVTTDWNHYDGNFGSVISYPQLSKEEIEELLYIATKECAKTQVPRESIFGKIGCELSQKGVAATLKRSVFYIAKKLRVAAPPSMSSSNHKIEFGSGWYDYDIEGDFRPMGKESSCRLRIKNPLKVRSLRLSVKAPGSAAPTEIDLFVDNRKIASFKTAREWENYRLPLNVKNKNAALRIATDKASASSGGNLKKYTGLIVRDISLE